MPTWGAVVHPSYSNTVYGNYNNVTGACLYLGVQSTRGVDLITSTSNTTRQPLAQQWVSKCHQKGLTTLADPGHVWVPTDEFGDYLEELDAAYPGTIIAVEGLNEPDLFWSRSWFAKDRINGETWQEYAKRYQDAIWYQVRTRKGLNHIKVLGPCIGHPTPSAPGGNNYPAALTLPMQNNCDVANLHWYPGQATGTAPTTPGTQRYDELVQAFADCRAYSGLTANAEVWVTECGIDSPTHTTDYFGTTTGLSQAETEVNFPAFVDALTSVTAQLPNPATNIYIYQLVDDGQPTDFPLRFGMFNGAWAIKEQGRQYRLVTGASSPTFSKWYLPSTNSDAFSITPAVSAEWLYQEPGWQRRKLRRTAEGSAMTSEMLHPPSASLRRVLSSQYISEPLTAGQIITTDDQINGALIARQDSAGWDGSLRTCVKIVSRDGLTVRTILYTSIGDPADVNNVSEVNTSATLFGGRSLPWGAFAVPRYVQNEYITQSGDRLVLEIGAYWPAVGGGRHMDIAYGDALNASDHALSESTNINLADFRPWFGITVDLLSEYQEFWGVQL